FDTIYDCQQLIEEHLIDYIRTTVVHAGGISHLRKIASLAELHHVRTGSHGATDLSPVSMAAALHVDLSVHNFGIQEYMRHTDDTRFGYAAITWGGDDLKAIDDVAAVGFPGIQIRSNILETFGSRPAALREILAQHHLTLVALSSGTIKYDPAFETQVIAEHTS